MEKYLVSALESAATNLFDALQSLALKELCSVWGYESELEDLERAVRTIRAVLLDAKSMQSQIELSNEAQVWVDELKEAVYDAEDLLDEFVTIAEQKQLRAKDAEDDSLFKKVRRFFSFDNPLLVALNMSQGIKEIKNKLDIIADNHNKFGFKLDCQPIRKRREESCSNVYAQNIIGRDDDVEKIVGMLQDSNIQQDVSVLTIVGVGGLGKTGLAQLVYNDQRIKDEFPLRLWTCISDHDEKSLDIKSILIKIVQSATRTKHEYLDMDHLHRQLQKELVGKKYLLVLDDLWNEDRHQWFELVKFLIGGLKGSWIVVTTRSRVTAEVVGSGPTHDLKGLLEEDSWRLFKREAFGPEYEQADPHLVQIGHQIVKKCLNVSLAILVVARLLYGHNKDKWLSFQEISLGRIKQGENGGIEPILKLSYDNLESPLKICFSYILCTIP